MSEDILCSEHASLACTPLLFLLSMSPLAGYEARHKGKVDSLKSALHCCCCWACAALLRFDANGSAKECGRAMDVFIVVL